MFEVREGVARLESDQVQTRSLNSMNKVSGSIRLCIRVPHAIGVEMGEWTAGDWGGLSHWYVRRLPGEEIPPFLVESGRASDFDVHIVDDTPDVGKTLAWSAFFEDYFGVTPHQISPTSSESLQPASEVRLTRNRLCHGLRSSLIVVQSDAPPRAHSFQILRNHPVTFPLRVGTRIPFRGACLPIDDEGMTSLVANEEGQPVVACRERKPLSVVFGFDPISALWEATRNDDGPQNAGVNGNWIWPMLRSFIWSSPTSVWKGFWPDGIPPILYTIDAEAAVKYFNAKMGKCVWAATRPRAHRPIDTKLSESLRTSVGRLDRYGLIGTFYIDLNAVMDSSDQISILETNAVHDVALHVPVIGTHEDWKALVRDPEATSKSLQQATNILSSLTRSPVKGFRCASWYRTSSTHDLVAQAALGYDSSTFAVEPFLTVPYRLFAASTGERLPLWELPCRQVDQVANRGRFLAKGVRTRWRLLRLVRAHLTACGTQGTMAVLSDHDMTIGSAYRHVHGSWRPSRRGLRAIMRAAYRQATSNRLKPMRGRDFLAWWEATRAVTFQIQESVDHGRNIIRVQPRWEHVG